MIETLFEVPKLLMKDQITISNFCVKKKVQNFEQLLLLA